MMHETTIDFSPQKNWDDAMARFEHCAVAESCKHRIGLLGAVGWLFPTGETHLAFHSRSINGGFFLVMGCQMMPGMSPVQCMKVAEHLYTSGYISYTAQMTETAHAESSGFEN